MLCSRRQLYDLLVGLHAPQNTRPCPALPLPNPQEGPATPIHLPSQSRGPLSPKCSNDHPYLISGPNTSNSSASKSSRVTGCPLATLADKPPDLISSLSDLHLRDGTTMAVSLPPLARPLTHAVSRPVAHSLFYGVLFDRRAVGE